MRDALEEIPGVGPRTAEDLRALGVDRVDDLVGRDPEQLYARLIAHQGPSDRCNLYVYRCAIYYAEGGRDPRLLHWWHWKDEPTAKSKRKLSGERRSGAARSSSRRV